MMPLSRRSFLGAAAAVPLALYQRLKSLRGNGLIRSLDAAPPRCLLVDAGKRCVLQESLTGFARGLAVASIHFERVSVEVLTYISCDVGAGLVPARGRPQGSPLHPISQLVIIPGAVIDSRAFAQTMRCLTDCGSTVLYESGAAYAEPGAIETERRLLRDYFGLSVQAPRELWPSAGTGDPPYVCYRWPSAMMIRDFSRVIPVSADVTSSSHIAYLGETAIASHRQIGKGWFIFLGSPLGPHLGFGDAEAQRLLSALVSERDLKSDSPRHDLPAEV
jgi:hypothetical protein